MPRFLKPTIVLAAVAAVCFTLRYFLKGAEAYLATGFAASLSAVIFFVMTVVTLVQRVLGRKETSPWKLFTVTNAVLLVTAVVWGIIGSADNSQESTAGIAGAVMLYLIVPILAAMLLFALMAWKVYSSMKEEDTAPAGEPVKDTEGEAAKPVRPVRIKFEERPRPETERVPEYSPPPDEFFSLGTLPPPNNGSGKR